MTLSDYLESTGQTLQEFSAISGLHHSYLSRIQTGRLPASRRAIIAIHNATEGQVSFLDLVGNELANKDEVTA